MKNNEIILRNNAGDSILIFYNFVLNNISEYPVFTNFQIQFDTESLNVSMHLDAEVTDFITFKEQLQQMLHYKQKYARFQHNDCRIDIVFWLQENDLAKVIINLYDTMYTMYKAIAKYEYALRLPFLSKLIDDIGTVVNNLTKRH